MQDGHRQSTENSLHLKKNNIKLPPYTYKNSTEKAGSRLDRHPGIRVLVTDKIPGIRVLVTDKIFFPDKIIFLDAR